MKKHKSLVKMKMNIEEILWNYFRNEVSAKETELISIWLDQSKENKRLFAVMKKIFMEIEADAMNDPLITEKAYQKFLYHISISEEEKKTDNKIGTFLLQKNYMWYAAIIVLMFSLSALTYYLGSRPVKLTDNNFCEIEVPYGGKSMLTLPDGSKIWLNAGSNLKYNRDFDINSRDVYLEGEAYFDVEKRKHPFVVHTSHLDIHVLGTAFNVKSYPEDENIETTLVRGNIRIEDKETNQPLFLKPKEKLTFHKTNSQSLITNSETKDLSAQKENKEATQEKITQKVAEEVVIKENVNTDESTSWKDGKLIINNETLGDLTKKLERKYDIVFTFDTEELKKYTYSGTIRDFPLEQVLKALELTSPIYYTIKEKKVSLHYNNQFKPIT